MLRQPQPVPGMSLGALVLRMIAELRQSIEEQEDEDEGAPGVIVTSRTILSADSSTDEEGAARHIIIFFGGPSSSSLSDFVSSDSDFEQVLSRLALLHQPQGPPPATKSALDALPTVAINDKDLAESPCCSICCEEFRAGVDACKLPCLHVFDRACVMEWLSQHNTCPICRYELAVEDSEKERSRKERMAARGIDEDAFYAAHAKKAKALNARRKRKERDHGAEDSIASVDVCKAKKDGKEEKQMRKEEKKAKREEKKAKKEEKKAKKEEERAAQKQIKKEKKEKEKEDHEVDDAERKKLKKRKNGKETDKTSARALKKPKGVTESNEKEKKKKKVSGKTDKESTDVDEPKKERKIRWPKRTKPAVL